jgi:arylsulfatase A-like enzyme
MKTIAALFLSLAAFHGLVANAKQKPSPNLIFVFPDEMRAQALGFLGEEKVLTPVLDKFAKESVYFSNAVSNYPVCSPTRAMIFSGQYPVKNRVIGNCTSVSAQFGCELPADTRCWSDVLKEKGYSLGYIGKWHLDSPHAPFVNTSNNAGNVKWNEWTPPSRRHGFDYWHAYGTYDQHLRPMYWDTDAPRDSFKYYDEWGPEHEADRAIDFIRNKNGKLRKNGQPFALVVSMNPPHMDYKAVPQKYKDPYKDLPIESLINKPSIDAAGTKWGDHYRKSVKDYYAGISGVDEQFGRILKVLEEDGLAGNTLVVFTSDHGDCMGIHGEITKNNLYEESMRVPLLIRFPGRLKPHTDDILLSTPDLYPTLLGLLGFASAIPETTDGENFAGYLMTGKGKKPVSQWYMRISDGNPAGGLRGVRTDRYTFVIDQGKERPKEVMLFDRRNDPFQMKNIAGESTELSKELTSMLKEWLVKYQDPWLKNLE